VDLEPVECPPEAQAVEGQEGPCSQDAEFDGESSTAPTLADGPLAPGDGEVPDATLVRSAAPGPASEPACVEPTLPEVESCSDPSTAAPRPPSVRATRLLPRHPGAFPARGRDLRARRPPRARSSPRQHSPRSAGRISRIRRTFEPRAPPLSCRSRRPRRPQLRVRAGALLRSRPVPRRGRG
jgi:hypothetical protein